MAILTQDLCQICWCQNIFDPAGFYF